MSAPAAPPRFGFGANWAAFARRLTPERVERAEASLREMLETDDLRGRTFLDVGCGSGLFSLAALRLGAERVVAFDVDPASVETARAVLEAQHSGDSRWTVELGDVLDAEYMSGLGPFDVVYAWGVLHHTGDLAAALRRTAERVAPGGRLFIAVYNDEGPASRRWRRIKRTYNRLPRALRPVWVVVTMAPREARDLLKHLRRGDPIGYVRTWTGGARRGMDKWRDMVDWVGGYPFEVATPEEIFRLHRRRGFTLAQLRTSRQGNNEYVFIRRG